MKQGHREETESVSWTGGRDEGEGAGGGDKDSKPPESLRESCCHWQK